MGGPKVVIPCLTLDVLPNSPFANNSLNSSNNPGNNLIIDLAYNRGKIAHQYILIMDNKIKRSALQNSITTGHSFGMLQF